MFDLHKWIDSDPEDYITNPDGSKSLTIEVIEEKLNKLTDKSWGTSNFSHITFAMNNSVFMSGGLQLDLFYEGIQRSLVGSYTIDLSEEIYKTSKNIAGALKSLCIVNAASEIGRQFGSHLNPREIPANQTSHPPKRKREAVEMIPDAAILKRYEEAKAKNDTKTITSLESVYSSLKKD